jgi:rubredoxin
MSAKPIHERPTEERPVEKRPVEQLPAVENILMECRICWQVYDPEQGDDLGQIAPGTPFTELPDDWHCPRCDADKSLYLVRA